MLIIFAVRKRDCLRFFMDVTNLEKILDLILDLGSRFGFDFGFMIRIWFIKIKSIFEVCKSTTATKFQTVYTMDR
jgi:hypothetical protein